jgi:hypothetical protein
MRNDNPSNPAIDARNITTLVVENLRSVGLPSGRGCISYESKTSPGRSKIGYRDKYDDMAKARIAGKLSPCTALEIDVRIAVFVKTNVDRERHVAMVNGFSKNAAPASQGGNEFTFRLDV